MKKLLNSGAYLLGLLLVFSCNNSDKAASNAKATAAGKKGGIEVKAAPEWAEMIKRDSGWIGADGIYCVPLDGVEAPGRADSTETLFWFSDCVYGTVDGDTLKSNWEVAHNSVAYMKGGVPDGSKIKFFDRKDKDGHYLSMFEPTTPLTNKGEYYWLGDGFFNHATDSTIYIFAYRIKNIPDGGIWPFDDVGVSLIAIPKGEKPPFAHHRQIDVPFFLKDSPKGKVVFGSCVLANTVGARTPKPDGYVYVYGIRGPYKELLVARVPDKDFERFTEWRFWDGKDWNKDVNSAAALASGISNEMSVSYREDGHALLVYYQQNVTPNVMVQVAKTPWGPFQLPHKIWETPEVNEDIDFYTYNAKAHPHLSRPGELLISYNVNSFDFLDDITKHPHHLRPRFITLKY